jgi:Tfp pilus assembly protein PilO
MARFIFPLAILGLSVILFTSFTMPIFSETKEFKTEEAVFQSAIDNARQLQLIRDDLLKKYNAFDATSVERLNVALPANVENVKLIMDIDNIASKYGIAIRDVKVSQAPENAGGHTYSAALLGFSFSGPYAALKLFLQDLAKSLRLVDVTSLSFVSSDRDFYDYSLELKAYWLK